jgi:hypothetical protein
MFQTSFFYHQEHHLYIHFKKRAFCWLTLHTVSQCTVQKTHQTNFTHEIKITYCLMQSIRQALVSFNKGKINCRTVPQLLQGPCMNLLSFSFATYIQISLVFQPHSFSYVYICIHTSNINTNPLKTKRRPLYLKTQSVPRCKHFSSRL